MDKRRWSDGGGFARGDVGFGPGRQTGAAIYRGSTPSRIYDISADGKTILFVEMSYGQAAEDRDLYARNGWLAGGALGRRQPARAFAGWQVGGMHLERRPEDVADFAADRVRERRAHSAPGMHYERVEWFPDGQKLLFTGNEPDRPHANFHAGYEKEERRAGHAGGNGGDACFARSRNM